jgi:hypothetical protein
MKANSIRKSLNRRSFTVAGLVGLLSVILVLFQNAAFYPSSPTVEEALPNTSLAFDEFLNAISEKSLRFEEYKASTGYQQTITQAAYETAKQNYVNAFRKVAEKLKAEGPAVGIEVIEVRIGVNREFGLPNASSPNSQSDDIDRRTHHLEIFIGARPNEDGTFKSKMSEIVYKGQVHGANVVLDGSEIVDFKLDPATQSKLAVQNSGLNGCVFFCDGVNVSLLKSETTKPVVDITN